MEFSNHIYTDNRRLFMNDRNQKLSDAQFEVVAIGDSITEGLNLNRFEYIDYTWLNSGISGDISTLLNARLEADCLAFKPQIVSLMIGINDIRNYFNKMDYIYRLESEAQLKQELIANIVKTVEELLELGIKVVYTQILPVNEIEKNNGYINQFIDCINDQIKALLANRVAIIETRSFKNKVNSLDLNMTYDGLHLNELGYQNWCQLLNDEIKKIKQGGN